MALGATSRHLVSSDEAIPHTAGSEQEAGTMGQFQNAATRLADLADGARALGQRTRADGFLLMAWAMYDADELDAPVPSLAQPRPNGQVSARLG